MGGVADRHPKRSSKRGPLTILAMFALGGLVLLGLFLAPRPHSPPAPPGVAFGAPDTPLRVVVYDLTTDDRPVPADSIAADVRGPAPGPDYVLLLGLEADQAPPLAAAMGMQESFEPRLYQRVRRPGRREPVGACLLSRRPLYDASPLRTSPREVYGVCAVSVVDGRKFLLACVSLPDGTGGAGPGTPVGALIDSWRGAGAPPMLVAGDIGAENARALVAAGFAEVRPENVTSDAATPATMPALPRLLATAYWTAGQADVILGQSTRGTGLAAVVGAAPHPATSPRPSTASAPAEQPQDVLRRE
jgi:hypothetical protein